MNKIVLESENIIIDKEAVYYLSINNNLNYKIRVLKGINSKLIIINILKLYIFLIKNSFK